MTARISWSPGGTTIDQITSCFELDAKLLVHATEAVIIGTLSSHCGPVHVKVTASYKHGKPQERVELDLEADSGRVGLHVPLTGAAKDIILTVQAPAGGSFTFGLDGDVTINTGDHGVFEFARSPSEITSVPRSPKTWVRRR